VTAKPALARSRPVGPSTPRPADARPGRFDGRSCRTAVYRWVDLAPGNQARGPAVIAGGEATVVVPPSFRFAVDRAGNVRLRQGR
jgi:N-methylhydantoinase A